MTADRPIVLMTDFGTKDPYAGIMKGVIYGIAPHATVLDLTHNIDPQDIHHGAFILEKSFRYFPEGAIFTVVVDPGVGTGRRIIGIDTGDFIFIAPDNGILGFCFSSLKIVNLIEFDNPGFFLNPVSSTFHGRDIFAPLSARLSMGTPLNAMGHPVDEKDLTILPDLFSNVDKKRIEGIILFADRFGNLVTNIESALLEGKRIESITAGGRPVTGILGTFSEGRQNEPSALIGSYGTLEICVKNDSALDLLKIGKRQKVEIILKGPE